jgi:Family of unknown function (DUF5677)
VTSAPTWIEFSAKLINAAYAVLSTASLKVGPEVEGEADLVAMTLLARTAQHMKGVILLAQEGLVVEARILTRCCFENEFWIEGLKAEGSKFADRMMDEDAKSRQLRGKFLLESRKRREAPDDDGGEKLRKWVEDSITEFPKAGMLKPKEVASLGTLKEAYMFYSQLSSDAAHPSLEALNRHIGTTQEDGEETTTFIHGAPPPHPNEIEETLNLACLAMIGCCIGANQILGETEGGKILDSLADEYKKIMK